MDESYWGYNFSRSKKPIDRGTTGLQCRENDNPNND
jgi:hypothetical protein